MHSYRTVSHIKLYYYADFKSIAKCLFFYSPILTFPKTQNKHFTLQIYNICKSKKEKQKIFFEKNYLERFLFITMLDTIFQKYLQSVRKGFSR